MNRLLVDGQKIGVITSVLLEIVTPPATRIWLKILNKFYTSAQLRYTVIQPDDFKRIWVVEYQGGVMYYMAFYFEV